MNRSPSTTTALRTATGALALVLVTVALMVDRWARRTLPGSPIDVDVLELRLALNRGVAFSVGTSLPLWVVVTVTASITSAVAVYAWRTARRAGTAATATTVALSLILAGALSNVIDRAIDGAVTDYFHTGWWPTFNLADVYITGGAILAIGAALFAPDDAAVASESLTDHPS